MTVHDQALPLLLFLVLFLWVAGSEGRGRDWGLVAGMLTTLPQIAYQTPYASKELWPQGAEKVCLAPPIIITHPIPTVSEGESTNSMVYQLDQHRGGSSYQ